MIDLLKLLGGLLVGVFRSHAAREAEMAFLRQQLVVLQRSAPARLRLRTADRLIFVWFYRLFPSLLEAAVVFKPETLVRWHRSGFRLYRRCESRHRLRNSFLGSGARPWTAGLEPKVRSLAPGGSEVRTIRPAPRLNRG